jgi:hypothetical protein
MIYLKLGASYANSPGRYLHFGAPIMSSIDSAGKTDLSTLYRILRHSTVDQNPMSC